MRGYGAAVSHWLHRYRNAAAIAQVAIEFAEMCVTSPAKHRIDDLFGRHFRLQPFAYSMFDDFLQGGSRPYLVGTETINLGVTSVAEDEAVFRVEHRKSLDNIVECCVQLHILFTQSALLLL